MFNKKNENLILLTGGGTVGSVSPLLAIVDAVRNQASEIKNSRFIWIGTRKGIEKEIVEHMKVGFKGICSGKLRRYFSWKNIIDPVFVICGFFQAFFILLIHRPDLIISAGSFVSVPVVWAGWILRIPILIHQMDYRPGLANKLMSPFASRITVSLKKSVDDYGRKAVWIGNFVRKEFKQYRISREESRQRLNLNNEEPVILVLGGGTGSAAINRLVKDSLPELTKFCQIMHITGRNKDASALSEPLKNYHSIEFVHIDGIIKSYMAADIVVSRSGMGVLTELSFLAKPSILIPLPNSHQEDNAEIFFREKAALVLDQNETTPKDFTNKIRKLLKDDNLRARLRSNIKKVIKTDADKEIVPIIKKIMSCEL